MRILLWNKVFDMRILSCQHTTKTTHTVLIFIRWIHSFFTHKSYVSCLKIVPVCNETEGHIRLLTLPGGQTGWPASSACSAQRSCFHPRLTCLCQPEQRLTQVCGHCVPWQEGPQLQQHTAGLSAPSWRACESGGLDCCPAAEVPGFSTL